MRNANLRKKPLANGMLKRKSVPNARLVNGGEDADVDAAVGAVRIVIDIIHCWLDYFCHTLLR